MSHARRNLLVCLLACGMVAGCDNTTVQTRTRPPVVRDRDIDRDDAGSPESSTEGDAGGQSEDVGEVVDEAEPESPTKAPPKKTPAKKPPKKPAKPDAGGDDPPPELPPVAGTAEAAGCHSYTESSGDMCGGYYCGVTVEQVIAETSSDARCSDPEYLCHSDLVNIAGTCARRVNASMLGASTAQLRVAIRDCIYEDGIDRSHVSEDCLSCYITSIECGGQTSTCLFDCLNGNSEQCDACLRDNDCVDPTFACTGLPSPF